MEETTSSVANALAGLDGTDLITVIISLIGASAAGYAVSWRETRIRREEETRRLDEERNGLLLLIDYEIKHNASGAQGFNEMRQQLEEVRKRYLKENEESKLADDETFDKFFDKMIVSSRADDVSLVLSSLRTDTWDKTSVRLAQLLEADQLEVLISYYSGIPLFVEAVQRRDLRKKETLDYLAGMIDMIISEGQKARTIIR